MSARSLLSVARVARSSQSSFSKVQSTLLHSSPIYLHRTFSPSSLTLNRFFSTESTSTSSEQPSSSSSSSSSTESSSSSNETKTASTPEQRVIELTKQVEEKEKQMKEINDKWLRAMAETENVRTRGQNQVSDAKKFAVQNFAKSLLEVADTLELALKSVKTQVDTAEKSGIDSSAALATLKNTYEGIEMTEKVLQKVFAAQGLKKFEPVGEKFNPHMHEGLFQVVDETKEVGTVAACVKPGYTLNERCIRAAQVGTVRK